MWVFWRVKEFNGKVIYKIGYILRSGDYGCQQYPIYTVDTIEEAEKKVHYLNGGN